MIELRFHRDLYPGELVDESIGLYEPYATLERAEEAQHWVVRVSADEEERARQVAGELANYALGLTIQKRGASQ